jgi:hypothetical protein
VYTNKSTRILFAIETSVAIKPTTTTGCHFQYDPFMYHQHYQQYAAAQVHAAAPTSTTPAKVKRVHKRCTKTLIQKYSQIEKSSKEAI